jgi:hypothetical protein
LASTRVQFGGPFRGYVSARARHRLGRDEISANSTNLVLNPFEGSLLRRMGSTIQGDTCTTGTSNIESAGLIEIAGSKAGYRVRQFAELDSISFSDGLPVPSALLTKETNAASFPAADTGYFGTHYLRDVAGATNQQLLKEFSATHYPSAGGAGSAAFDIKCVPLWYESGIGGYTRGVAPIDRQFITPGSRRWMDAGNWRYFPNLRGTPARWNKRLNTATGSGTEPNRVFPTGPWGPLFPPTVGAGAATTGSDANWKDGDTFYASVIFQFEDGSFSAPFIPRPKNARLSSGLGFITVGAVGGANTYRDLQWTNVPIGPDGTIARILCRSQKQNRAATTDILTISAGDIRICGVIRNNSDKTFTDTLGNDVGLLDDSNVVRLDYTLPRRARYAWTSDQRACVGYTLPNPSAIMLAPTGSATSRDLNAADTSPTILGATTFLVRITSDRLQLLKQPVGAPAPVDFTFAGYTTIQDMVDGINATTTASGCGEWAAAVAPGFDPSTNSNVLCPTTQDVSGCQTHTNTTLDGGAFTNVPIGARVSGTNVTPGTYVLSKQSASSITLSAATTGTGGPFTMSFYAETGDNVNVTGGTVGYIRSFAPSYPMVAYIQRTSQVNYDRPDKQSVYFTVASPGAATSGVSMAANSFVSGNKRAADANLGILQGGVDIQGASVVAYSKGIKILVNERGVTSGEDFDIRLKTVNLRRGCIAYDSLCAANGVALYLTAQGIVAFDKTRDLNNSEVIITNDIHNPTPVAGTPPGDLSPEINACIQGCRGDDDTGHFHAAVLGSQLHISFRLNGTSQTTPNRRMVYDFSPTAQASGVAELLNREGLAYGWSPMIVNNSYSCMCVVARAAGEQKYAWSDTNAGTGDGRFDLFDDPAAVGKDNGKSYVPTAYLAQIVAPPFQLFSAMRGYWEYFGSGNISVKPYRDPTQNVTETITMPAVAAPNVEFARIITEYNLTMRTNADVYEVQWTLGASETDGAALWRHDVEIEMADAY